MMEVGSVPVASSQARTSPRVAVPSLIAPRAVSADPQNAAVRGLPAASSSLRRPGSAARASAEGTLSSAWARSRRVSVLTERPACAMTLSASSTTRGSLALPRAVLTQDRLCRQLVHDQVKLGVHRLHLGIHGVDLCLDRLEPSVDLGLEGLEPGVEGVDFGFDGLQSCFHYVEPGVEGVDLGLDGVELGAEGVEPSFDGVESCFHYVEPGVEGVDL